jgi:uncharacterized protein (TIGR02284 family)
VADRVGDRLGALAQERRAVTSEFRTKIASLGGKSDVSGSATAALHRRFLDLRSMFQNDTKAAVAEVERGEGYLKERFETFMADEKLSVPTRDLIRATYERVRFDHARWDELKRAMQLTARRSSRREYGYRPDHAWSDMADTTSRPESSPRELSPARAALLPAGRLLNSGAGPCSYLMIGERNPNDVCVYPESNKIGVRALRSENSIFDMSGVRGYLDGEEAS